MSDPTLAAQIEALAPCPFCGGNWGLAQEPHDNHPVASMWFLYHKAPRCFWDWSPPHFDSAADAITTWNTRPTIVTALRQAETAHPSLELCVQFSEDGRHIRKWSRLPFDGGIPLYSHPAPKPQAEAAPGVVEAAVERMRENPYPDDVHLLGTTQQDERMAHYAAIAVGGGDTTKLQDVAERLIELFGSHEAFGDEATLTHTAGMLAPIVNDALTAEVGRLRGALIEAGREAGALLADNVTTDFLMYVPGEVKGRLLRVRAETIEAAAKVADRHDTGDCTREDMEARRIAAHIRALAGGGV